MIEIKRNCSSSVRNYDAESKITYGDFTIKLSDEEYDMIMDIMLELNLKAVDALQEVIANGLIYIEQQLDPDYKEYCSEVDRIADLASLKSKPVATKKVMQ